MNESRVDDQGWSCGCVALTDSLSHTNAVVCTWGAEKKEGCPLEYKLREIHNAAVERRGEKLRIGSPQRVEGCGTPKKYSSETLSVRDEKAFENLKYGERLFDSTTHTHFRCSFV